MKVVILAKTRRMAVSVQTPASVDSVRAGTMNTPGETACPSMTHAMTPANRAAARILIYLLVLAFALPALLVSLPSLSQEKGANGAEKSDEFLIVDCLLPGQVRKLGQRMNYLSPRRPVKTSASDCEIRGGEYVAFDRADYSTALKIWLPQAKEGDAEAQTYVGEIYEKGLGLDPDYKFAAYWYEQAVNQGYSRAQINLGHLYELGLGVQRDPRKALNLYRQASGIPQDDLLFASSLVSSHVTVEEYRNVQGELAQTEQQRRQLEASLAALNKDISQRAERLAQAEAELQATSDQLARVTAAVATTTAPVSATSEREAQLAQELKALQAEREGLEDHLATIYRENQSLERSHRELASELEARTAQQRSDKERYEALAKEMRSSLAGLQRSEQEADALKRKLREQQQDGSTTSASLAAMQREVDIKDAELNLAQQRYAELQASSREQASRLEAVSAKLDSQGEQVAAAEKAFRAHKEKLSGELALREKELTQTREQLLLAEAALQMERAAMAEKLQDQSAEQSAELSRQQDRLAQLSAQVERQSAQVDQQKNRIAELEVESEQFQEAGSPEVAMNEALAIAAAPAPRIEIIEPPVVLVRSMPTVRLHAADDKREVVGRVLAPAGIVSLSVNGRVVEIGSNNLFRASIPIDEKPKPVNVVVIDKEGRRAAVAFNFIQQDVEKSVAKAPEAAPRSEKASRKIRHKLGNYYALIIGNNDYRQYSTLSTAVNDARETDRILREKYHFKTRLLLNADRYSILSALNDLRETLDEDDNLLIYYAGHGVMDEANGRGYWLPVDADTNNNANWISNVAITDILNVINAKHVLVVADSCFSGTMTQSPIARADSEIPAELRSQWIDVMAETRARITLTSGGLEPVRDGGGGEHSLFAKAFLNALASNEDILEGYSLYYKVLEEMDKAAAEGSITQVPQYAPIHLAGHESGEFFFTPI